VNKDDTSHKEWDKWRRDTATIGHRTDAMLGIEPSYSDRYGRALRRARKEEDRKGNFSEADLTAAYNAYVHLVQDQQAVVKEGFDTRCLTALFEGCPNLDTVTLACTQSLRKNLVVYSSAFGEAMVRPYDDWIPESQGVDQAMAIAQAVCNPGKALKSLTFPGVHTDYLSKAKPYSRI